MENKKQDKIDKILQKVEQKSSKIYNEDNDPVIAAVNLLQTEEYMKGLKDPSFSSVFNTQMKLQDLEAKKDLYKAAKLQEEFSTEPYDDRYVDLDTGKIKRISENKNYNMELQTYDLASNFKSFLSGFAGDAIQGVGLGLDTAYNGLIGGLASVGEIGQYIFNGEEKNAETRKQLEKDLADNFDRISLFTDIANTLATPFNKYERDKNFVNIHQDLDYLGESFDKGNVKEFAKEFVNTGLHTVPTIVEGLFSYGAAVPALAKLNKENQAKELGVNPNEILDTTNKASLAELAGATVYGLGGKLSLASMKGAVGRGLIGQSGKASSGFIDSVATPTRSVFDKLKPNTLGEDIPGLNAALKAGYYGTLGAGKAVKNLAKYGSGVGLVALGEGLSEGVQTAGEKIATGDFQNKSFEENYKDLEESMLLGAIAGGGLGAAGKAVTAPISYVANKTKEREIFETTKQNAAKLSKTLNLEDMFSSSIKETTDSKGNVHKTKEVENPLDKLPQEEVELRDNIFHNLSQVSLDDYNKNPQNTAEDSPLNINKKVPLLDEVVTLGASGFLSNIQKDGTEIPSQTIIDESIGRAIQAVNEHIDSIIKTNPNTDTDGVMSTLAEFKEKMKDNPALDYYVARQMLTNPDQVKQLLARIIGEIPDTSVQNESEGEKLSSYENMTNAAIKQGQEAAVKEYTQEQLKNLKKASKFISELTGIEELAKEFDEKNKNNSKGSAVVTVQNILSNINKAIEYLSKPIDEKDDFQKDGNFQKGRNQAVNTFLSVMLTGTKTSTGEVKEGLAPMLKRIAQRQKEGKEFDHNGKTIREDRASLKWWLNSHRAKYGLLTYILKDLKENEAGEAIYTVPKDIDASGEVNKVFKEVKVYRGRDKIIDYIKTLVTIAKNNTSEEVDPGSIAERAKELIEALNNPEQIYIDDKKSLMEAVREFISIASGKHVFSTKPNNKEDLFVNIRENVKEEGGAIKAALDLIDPSSSSKTDSTTNKNNTTNNEEVTAKKNTQTTVKPKQEVKQEVKQEDSTNGDNNNDDIPQFDPDSKQGEVKSEQEYSPAVQKILEEASKETPAQKEFKKEELQELDARGEGTDMEGEELFNSTIPETLDEAQQEIKENAEKLINNVIEKRDKRIEEIEDPKQKSKAENERLDLNKILKAKDTPRSQLGLSIYENPENEEVKSFFYKDINEALISSFGIANQKGDSVNSLISFFGNIGTSRYISSKGKGTSNVSPLFSDNRARMSGIFRALDALVDFRFNNQEWATLKEKYPNLKNYLEVPKEDRIYFTRGISLSLLARDIGKKILSDVGLAINEENSTLGDEAAIHQELGMITIEALSHIGLVQTKPVTLGNVYNGMENNEAVEVRVILNLDNIFKNDGNVTKAMQFIDSLSRKFNLDNSNEVNTYSTTPFTTEKLVKTKKGVFAMPDKMYEAINSFLNTPFIVEHFDKVRNFITDNEKALKTFLGYKDVSDYVKDRDLKNGKEPTELYKNTGVFYSDIDSVLGKNLQVEEDIKHLKDLLVAKNSEDELIAQKGIYFNKTFSAGRQWIQSSTVNPQSKKLHRFLVTLQTQTREEKLDNEKLSDSTYIAIAQAFGYKTDKKTGAVDVGKAIVETEDLQAKVISALGEKGYIELGNGTKLEIEEIGHALNALFNIEAFKEALDDAHKKNEKLESFTHNIIAEVDGINNGIALKGLTFMASPKLFNPLLSTGISFYGELKDKTITQLFDASSSIKDEDSPGKRKVNPDKAYDTYELFAIKTSESFKRLYKAISKEKYSDEEINKIKGLQNKDEKDVSPEEKELLAEYENHLEINNNINDLSEKLVKKDTNLKEFTPKIKEVVSSFSKALVSMNNLIFVEGTNESVIESVPKEARSTNKFIVIPASYGSGLTANARSLTTYVMDNLKDWMLEYVDIKSKDIATQEAFQNTSKYKMVVAILEAIDLSKVTLKYTNYNGNPVTTYFKGNGTSLENYNNVIKELILNSKESIGDIKVIDSNRATTPKAESLYEFVDRYMKIITIEAVRNSRDELLPGYEPINNSINSIHNSFVVILNAKYNEKAYDILKSRISNIKKENIPTELLTVAEHKKIMKELKKDFPSITVDSKIRFGKNKEKKHVGRLSTVNIQSKVSPTKNAVFIPSVYVGKDHNGKNIYMGNKTLTMSYERLEFGNVGATPTANITQQNDGSDMTDLSLEGRNEQGQIQQNDIFDAVTLNPAEYVDGEPTIISKYNENQIKRGLNSSQLYEQTALAAKAARDLSEVDEKFLSLSDLETKGFNPNSLQFSDPTSSTGVKKFSIQEILQIYYNNLAGTMHSYYTISEVNKAIVKQLEIIGSNMQNGEESDKAIIEPKRIDLAALIKSKGYDVREYVSDNLMIDITSKEISSKISVIESYLNLIYDNKISNNKKDTDKITIETLDEEVKNLRSIIEGKIKSIKDNLEYLGASTFANDLTKYIQPLGEGPFSLEAQREEESGRDVYQDIEEIDKDKIDREAKDEEIKSKEETIEEKVEENNSLSSNSSTKTNEIKESTKPDTNTAKELEPNAEYQGDMEVIERLANALEQLLKPKSQKDKGIEGINPDVAKENTSARVEKVKNKINEILKAGFGKDVDLRKLGKGFTKLKESFKEKLENFDVDKYLENPKGYLDDLFKDIVGKDSIFDKINKEVLKSFENVDDTKVGDTSMDEFVSQIDLTTDKVSTTQEQIRSIDEANGRAMSKEFSNHLKGVLSELSSLASEAVNGVKVKYFKSKGKGHNEGEFLTNLREILIKEGIPLSKGNFTGTASLEETYGHELLHAITYYVIKAQAGGNPLTRELSMLHKRYLSVMTPSKLAKHINSGIPSKDLEVANRIIGHFENNTIEGLSEFIAIALSNEAVWNSLKDIEVKSDPNYDGMTFGERVVAKAMKMFNTFFNSIYRKYQDNDNMQKAMIALATKIATANSKAEYKIDKEMAYNTLEAADTLTTVANSLATGLDKVDEVTSEKLNKLKDYVKSKGVKLVSVPKSRRRKYNSRWEEIRGLVAILASDVVGDKTAQAALSVAHDFGFHYNGVMQYVVSELSQMSEVKRKAEYLSRQRKLLDANRVSDITANTEALEEYFNTPLTLAENQALGEGMLDTDLSSLLDYYSIDELPDILNNIESYKEKAYSDMLKEVDNNFKDRVGKYSKDNYKRYITNQANSLAYFMNYQSYRNEVEGAIGIKNPTMIAMAVGTGANLKPNKKVVSAIDKYVTLAALEYLESDVKDLIIDKLHTEPKGMEAMMNYHRTNKAESLEKNFGGNPALMMKGYRYDVVEDYIDIKIAPVSEESLLKSQGFRRVSKEPLRKSSDDNSEERALYINDFIPSTASFNQQAVSYLGHTGRGSKLSDIYNDKILKGADVRTVEQEWYDSIVDLTKNSSLAARKLMSPNYSPANYKDKKDSENIMIPIFDEHGDLRDFAYLMSKKTKKDLLGLDTSLTKSLSHMSARTTDKYEAQKLNERVADELYKDYAQANSAERQYHFVEMSFESKDPYIREIYKMLEPSFKNYLEEKFGGKIMVRASTMLNFFGQRDMDYRNTANYREKDVPYKKVLLASLDVARQVAKLAKMEIVLRFGSTIYNNFVSNGITLLIRGVPITSIAKDQIEGGRLLNKYLKDTKELKKLEAKKKAGGDVRNVEIENLKRELERNPIRDMMEFGLFSTIQTFEDINLDDKDNSWTARQVRKYTVENENIPENVREWMQKGYDWAFVTDRTVIGKNLTKLVQMGDFVARYALYKHYMRDTKMSKKEALEKVSDEFINYDLPVNKAVKFANDYGFLFFTRYYLVSQKVMAMLASDRPVSAGLVVGLQSLFNTDFADIFDGNVLTKNAGELVSDPLTNLYRSLSPTGYDLVKGAYSRI